jgi:hypothetical protein
VDAPPSFTPQFVDPPSFTPPSHPEKTTSTNSDVYPNLYPNLYPSLYLYYIRGSTNYTNSGPRILPIKHTAKEEEEEEEEEEDDAETALGNRVRKSENYIKSVRQRLPY